MACLLKVYIVVYFIHGMQERSGNAEYFQYEVLQSIDRSTIRPRPIYALFPRLCTRGGKEMSRVIKAV